MADLSATKTYHNVIGNKREEYGEFTPSGVTVGYVITRLHWIDAAFVEPVQTTGEREVNIYVNADDGTEDDDGGYIYFDNLTDGTTYRYRAIGV